MQKNKNSNQLTVCVTGAAGQIAYSFIPLLLKGNVFGNSKINLKLLDIAAMNNVMKGVIMQIKDCAFPLCKSLESGDNPKQMFKNADVIVFIGGFPRKKGMERKDLLQKNKNIFVEQASALQYAKPNVKCVIVANPANTNATILSHYSKVPPQNITCLTRLDHNRAISQIAEKLSVQQSKISGIFVLGNHSPTQYPSIKHIKVNNEPVSKFINEQWLKNTFIPNVQKRGGQIINVRGGSSVFSAACAVVDHLRDWYFGSNNKIVSMGVISKGQYGIPKGLWSSFPVRCKDFQYQIVKDYQLSDFCKECLVKTVQELKQQLKDVDLSIDEPKAKL